MAPDIPRRPLLSETTRQSWASAVQGPGSTRTKSSGRSYAGCVIGSDRSLGFRALKKELVRSLPIISAMRDARSAGSFGQARYPRQASLTTLPTRLWGAQNSKQELQQWGRHRMRTCLDYRLSPWQLQQSRPASLLIALWTAGIRDDRW